MLKKILLGFGIALVAIFVFLAVQLNQLKTEFAQALANQQIQVQEIALNLLGKPKVILHQTKYHQFQAEKMEVELHLGAALKGNLAISALDIQSFYWNGLTDNLAHIQGNFEQGVQLNQQNIDFAGNNQLHITFTKPVYGKAKQFDIQFKNARLAIKPNAEYELQTEDVVVNQQEIGSLEVRSNANEFLATLENGKIYYRTLHSGNSEAHLSGTQFPLEKLTKILALPQGIKGNTNFDAHIEFQQGRLSQGLFSLTAQNGEIEGFNLFQLVGRYLPINYDENALQQKNLNTPFDELYTELAFNQRQLQLQKVRLKTPIILARGEGMVDFASMQCDVNLLLSSAKSKYEQIELPVQFFGDCKSPQYRVKFNKDFRRTLKEMIKQKLR